MPHIVAPSCQGTNSFCPYPWISLFVLRPDERVLPEFLAWYINQRPAQRYIEEHSTGTSASLINLEAMKRLPVEAPPAETQARITKIHQLSLREKELMEAIQNKRRELIEMALLKTIGLSPLLRS